MKNILNHSIPSISVSPLRFLRKSTPNPLWEAKKHRNIRFWAVPLIAKSVQDRFQTYKGVEYDGRTQHSWVVLGLKLNLGCATAPPSRRFDQNQRFQLFWDTFSEVWGYCGISSERIAEVNPPRGPHITIFTQKNRFGGMPTTLRGKSAFFCSTSMLIWEGAPSCNIGFPLESFQAPGRLNLNDEIFYLCLFCLFDVNG